MILTNVAVSEMTGINELDDQFSLTPQAQSSDRNLLGTIVPWRDNFDKW